MKGTKEPSVQEYFLGKPLCIVSGILIGIIVIPATFYAYPKATLVLVTIAAGIAVAYQVIALFLVPMLLRVWRRIRAYRPPVKVTIVVEHKNTQP